MAESLKRPSNELVKPLDASSPLGTQATQHKTSSCRDRAYEFFVTTEEPHQPEGVERGIIRRLVMQNFFIEKAAGPQTNMSEQSSASTVLAKKILRSRFRLSVSVDGKKDDQGKGKGKRSKASRKTSRASAEWGLGNDVKGTRGSPAKANDHTQKLRTSDIESADLRLVLKTDLGAHRFDPFDVLPVPGTQQLDTLFKLFKSASPQNSIAIDTKHTWRFFVLSDAGLLHATLASWALYGMLVKGLTDLRVEKLRHKNDAIVVVNSKLGGEITDELVGTVLVLAGYENLIGAYDLAKLHITALRRMVHARGGLFAFGHNDGLLRGIIWTDFHTSTAFHTPPSFPHICLDPDTPPLPDELMEEAACTSPTSLLQLSLESIACFNIFYRLHRLALAVSSQWQARVARLTVGNMLYEVQFGILSVLEYSHQFLDYDENANEERKRRADAASVVEGLLAATSIFVYVALRALPTNAKLFSILLDRLRIALHRPNTSVIEVWKRENNANILVWVLVVACLVAPLERRAWWILNLADVCEDMNIMGKEELETILRRVAWTDGFFEELGGIWAEVLRFRRRVCSFEAETGTIDPSLLATQVWD